MRASIILGAVSVLLLSTSHLEKLRPPPPSEGDELRALPAEVRRTLTFGFRESAADFAWLDAIQYYGDPAHAADRYAELAPLLDVVTDLDPHFDYAYQFAGEAVPTHDATGEKLWHHTREAIALLRKGMANSPRRWEIPWLLSYDLYTYWGEYREAGQIMLSAADLAEKGQRDDELLPPPTYLRSLALRLLAQGGSLDTAIETTRLAAARATDDQARQEIQARLAALTLDKELQDLNALAQNKAGSGQAPTSLSELTAGSELQGLSRDPYGDAFYLDAEGRVRSSNEDRLLRLHIHPGEPAIERAVD